MVPYGANHVLLCSNAAPTPLMLLVGCPFISRKYAMLLAASLPLKRVRNAIGWPSLPLRQTRGPIYVLVHQCSGGRTGIQPWCTRPQTCTAPKLSPPAQAPKNNVNVQGRHNCLVSC
jgi:hypothetical protein